MSIYITILILLSLAVTFLLVRGYLRKQKATAVTTNNLRRNKAPSRRAVKQRAKKAAPTKHTRSSFKAASLHGLPGCCQAAKDLEETRFLMDKLPNLPLEACDRLADCQCSFTQHSDRRDEDRRRPRHAFSRQFDGDDASRGDNRRAGLDRRSELADEIGNIKFE